MISPLHEKRFDLEYAEALTLGFSNREAAQLVDINEIDIVSVASEVEAIEYIEEIASDPCIDNHRIGYFRDEKSLANYDDAYASGCCGSIDKVMIIGGRPAIVGCNYGH